MALPSTFEVYPSFRAAAERAVALPPPYLIKQLGNALTAPGSALYEGPAATTNFHGAALLDGEGAAIGVQVTSPHDFDPAAPDQTRFMGGETLRAIVDTGGFHSAIDETLAQRLGLPPINRAEIVGVTGAESRNFYLGLLFLRAMDWYVLEQLVGVTLGDGQNVIHLGRPFLGQVTFLYDGQQGRYALGRPRPAGTSA